MAANDGLLAFVHEYMDQLADLTSAVKSKINSLSMLAAEEAAVTPAAASAVAAAIEKRIQKVSTRGAPGWHSPVSKAPRAHM